MYSYNNQYPQQNLPHKIRLADGLTKTDSSTFTKEDIENAGYREVLDPPVFDKTRQTLTWYIDANGLGDWRVIDISVENKWQEIRTERDNKMRNFEWRISRNNREKFFNKRNSELDVALHLYMQALADITKQSDPFAIVWPQYPDINIDQ
jgi:hypothetical protein